MVELRIQPDSEFIIYHKMYEIYPERPSSTPEKSLKMIFIRVETYP